MANKNDSLTALSAGQVQVVASDSLDASDAPVLDTLPGAQAHYTPGSAWEHLTFNLDNPSLADPSVRQAIAYALDRNALDTQVMAGKAEVAAGQVPSWSWAFDVDLQKYDHNVPKANQLLDAAGWTRGADGVRAKGGQRLSYKYWYTPASFRPALVSMIKDQLAQVGIEVNPQSIDSSTLFDISGGVPQSLVNRQFDIVEFAWVSSYDPGGDGLFNMASPSVPSKTNGFLGGNYGNYKNPRIDTLMTQLQNSIEPAFRATALHEAQVIWQSDLPVIPLLLRPVTTASATGLLNFKPTPAPAGETWNVEQWTLASSS
jgi:peptide/nickel transport system substrate-binding protein